MTPSVTVNPRIGPTPGMLVMTWKLLFNFTDAIIRFSICFTVASKKEIEEILYLPAETENVSLKKLIGISQL